MTVLATVLTMAAGKPAWVVVGVAATVLAGQLSIGWSNDALDVRRDTATGRTDKPLVAGEVSVRAVTVAAGLATLAAGALSLWLGWQAAAAHAAVVASGWLYNLWLKSTPASPVPFFVAFGLLPAVATLTRPDPGWPPPWVLVAGGLIGVAAHFANVLPDLDDDAQTGVRGLPHRIGPLASALAATGAAVAAVLLVVTASEPPPLLAVSSLLVAVVVVGAGLLAVRRRRSSEGAFYASMAVAAIGVALLAASPRYGG